MSEETPPAEKRPVPWRGRPRTDNPRSSWVHIRVTAEERKALEAAAERQDMSLGPYVVAAALKAPQRRGRRRPSVDLVQLSQSLGLLGKVGGNLNQLTKLANQTRQAPDFERFEMEFRGQLTMIAQGISAALRGKIVAELPQPAPEEPPATDV